MGKTKIKWSTVFEYWLKELHVDAIASILFGIVAILVAGLSGSFEMVLAIFLVAYLVVMLALKMCKRFSITASRLATTTVAIALGTIILFFAGAGIMGYLAIVGSGIALIFASFISLSVGELLSDLVLKKGLGLAN